MMCRNPYMKGTQPYGCGQCVPCRANQSRVWKHRIMLEANQHYDNAFVTLTYRPEDEPEGGNLAKEEFQKWIKRFRFAIEPRRIRYYAVGEYGEKFGRPHYHLALFGYGPCKNGRTSHTVRRQKCCDVCDTIRDTWGHGNVYVGDLEPKSAGYVASYVANKNTRETTKRVDGRVPEFGLMSRRPAIGTGALWEIASVLLHYDLHECLADVPGVLRNQGVRPIGRTLKEKLRLYVGKEKGAPQEVIEEMEKKVLALLEGYGDLSKVPYEARRMITKNVVMDVDNQRVLQQAARAKLAKRNVL